MLYPKYIVGTSLYGYFNQMVTVNAFDSRALFSCKERKYKRRNSSVYIRPFFTETFSATLGENLSYVIPQDKLVEIRASISAELAPFSAQSVTTYDLFAEKELKYCPECLARGEHYTYQQMKFYGKCREHGLDLVKGCPVCGNPLPATIEIEKNYPFGCTACQSRILKVPTASSFVSELIDRELEPPQHLRKQIVGKAEAGYVFANEGAESTFEENGKAFIFLKEYMKTGREVGSALTVNKNDAKKYVLTDLVLPFTDGKLKKSSKKVAVLDYISEFETTDKSAEDRAAAYLCRMLYSDVNPRRMGIKPLKQVIRDINRGLKAAGMGEKVKLVIEPILRQFLADTYNSMKDCLKKHPHDSLLLLTHDGRIPEVAYGIVILEDAASFHIHLFRA